jgi:hypothetical protein
MTRLQYLNTQLAYHDGETPLTDDERAMIRERNAILAKQRAERNAA